MKIIDQKKSLKERLAQVKNIIAVMSGKGGVGKSTVTVNLAVSLAERGFSVGIFDADFHGPSIPRMLNLDGSLHLEGRSLTPLTGPLGIKVISIDFLLPDRKAPVIWRGPMKGNMIRQLLADVDWGQMQYLLIDLPPGTGDEPLSVMQLIPGIKGIVLVTNPSELSEVIVDKAGNMARLLKIPILGVVENMSYFRCPNCNSILEIFGHGAGEKVSEYLKTPLLAKIPFDIKASILTAEPSSELKKGYDKLTERLLERIGESQFKR